MTPKLNETKFHQYDEVFFPDAFHRSLHKLQIVLPAYGREWIIE